MLRLLKMGFVLFQEITDGLPEEFADLHQELRGGLSKPRVSCSLKPFRVCETVQKPVCHNALSWS